MAVLNANQASSEKHGCHRNASIFSQKNEKSKSLELIRCRPESFSKGLSCQRLVVFIAESNKAVIVMAF